MLTFLPATLVATLVFALAAPATAADAATKPQAKSPEVVMYTTRTCGYCVKARAWLKERGVEWNERDIETSADAAREWKALGGVGTPLVVINGTPFTGFSPQLLAGELAKYGR